MINALAYRRLGRSPCGRKIAGTSILEPDNHKMNGAWSELALYESVDITKRQFQAFHQRQLSSGKAVEIASHLAQGREFFAAARDSGRLIHPLLLYYGVLALTRALILFRHRTLREAGLQKGHGLTAGAWETDLADRNVGALEAAITAGTFTQLAEATGNAEFAYIRLGGGRRARARIRTTPPVVGGHLIFRELVSRLPDLYSDYFDVTQTQPPCYPADVFQLTPDTHTDVSILNMGRGLPGAERLRADLAISPELDIRPIRDHGIAADEHLFFRFLHPAREFVHVVNYLRMDSSGRGYLVAPYEGASYSTISIMFALAYTAGMVVRYWPTQWRLLAVPAAGDLFLPLFDRAVNIIELEYPRRVLSYFQIQ